MARDGFGRLVGLALLFAGLSSTFAPEVGLTMEIRRSANGSELPLGSELQERINGYSNILDVEEWGRPKLSDAQIRTALSTLWAGSDPKPYVEALRQIHAGVYLRASIDDYLDRHRSNSIVNLCGKILIARAILAYEKESLLNFSTDNIFNTLDFSRVLSSWLIRFWQMLARDTPTEEIASSLDHVTFINFNYDRCLEHFLIQAFRGLDNWEQQKAHDFVHRHVSILHPYGTVGSLDSLKFGDDRADLVARAGEIKTYTEQIADNTLVDKIKHAILSANILIFLGFHFHRQNVELLTPKGAQISRVQRVYATVLGISPDDQNIVKSQLQSIARADVQPRNREYHLVDGDCAELFRRYEKTLDF